MTKKKILFLIPDLGYGGAEKVLVNLVNNINPDFFDITVQTLFDEGIYKEKILPHIHYKYWMKKTIRGYSHILPLFSSRLLYSLIVKDKYDICVSYLEGTSAKIISGCPYSDSKKIAWVHIELNNPKMVSRGFRNYKDAYNSYNAFDKTVFVSETVRKTFFKSLSKISSQNSDIYNKSLVLYNTNETKEIINKAMEPIDDMSFNEEEINLISVAKLMHSKGYDRLIPQIAKLNAERKNKKLHLYLVGVGEEKKTLQRLAGDNGITQYVTFLGFKENPYKYVKNADIYVCSSRREGFSTAVTEALIVGTPVVSTNCSGAFELIGYNNEYGIVVDNNEQGIYEGIKEMLSNDNYKNYATKALERGKKFSTEKTVEAVQKMLENLYE